MPIDIHRDGDVAPIEIRPGTNEARVLAFLAKHSDAAFTPAELAERTDVGRTSIYKTVDRLIGKDLAVRHPDGDHVHVNLDLRDRIYHRLRSFRDTETYERLFESDEFSEDPFWVSDLEDLGSDPLPEVSRGEPERGRDKQQGYDDLPDLGKE